MTLTGEVAKKDHLSPNLSDLCSDTSDKDKSFDEMKCNLWLSEYWHQDVVKHDMETSSDSICHLVWWRDSDYSKQELAHRRSIFKHLVLKFGSQEFHLHIFVSSLLYWSKSLFYSLTYSESIKWDRRPWHELVPMPLVVLSHITANSRNVFQPHW